MAEHMNSHSETAPISSSAPQTDAVIISAYGRGNWLASELSSRGWRVTLIDVTESLGPWEPEDAEGPFGLLETSDLFPSQKTRLLEEEEMAIASSGFSIWLKSGVIECRSELSSHHLDEQGIPKAVESYLRCPGLPDRDSEKMRRALLPLPFQKNWLAHFAHQLSSVVYEENHRALENGVAAPLFAPFSIRQVSANARNKGFRVLQACGVRIRQKAKVSDIRLLGRAVEVMEVQDDQSGVERGRTYVWMLSSAESERLSSHVAKVLFAKGSIEPDWFWARYRVNFEGTKEWMDDQVPVHTTLIRDQYLPWTHTNVIVLRKRAEKSSYDAWVRLPKRARGDAEYLAKIRQEIESELFARMPLFRPKAVGLPTEARAAGDILGPSPMPVFSPKEKRRLDTLRLSNLFYCGPEHWDFLDWTGQYRAQNKILTKLEKMRAAWLAEERRLEQRALAKEARRNKQGSASP